MSNPISHIPHVLFAARRQPARWLFVIAAAALGILALAALEYDSPTFYAMLAVACLCQAVYPTLAGWLMVLAIFATGSIMYFYASVNIARSSPNPGDLVLCVFFLLLCLAFSIPFAFLRPKPFGEE